jgi:hypothetical protein
MIEIKQFIRVDTIAVLVLKDIIMQYILNLSYYYLGIISEIVQLPI